MSDQNQPVIIIRKKKGGHGGHHGGAWKVAYADFMTAMMAFFLLMWLLNTATPAQRKAIADYFAPMGIALSEGGSGGVMGGASISSPSGAGVATESSVNVTESMTTTAGQGQEGDEDVPGKSDKSADGNGEKLTPQQAATKEAAALATAMKGEEEKFKQTESQILQAISQTPGLEGLAQHLVIDRTPEGLRIQIIDRDGFSLFPSGVSSPYEKGRDLLRLVGRVISRLPNRISVTGHTDSSPFSRNARRDNWDLSADRANVSRTELEAGGVQEDRIARVVGLADRDPFVPQNPEDPRNRRISIVLLRHGLEMNEPKPEAEPAPTAIKTKAKDAP